MDWRYHYLQNQMKDCEKKMERVLQEYIATLPPEQTQKESCTH